MINLILKLMENEALKTAFLKLANMSISASWLVLAILVLRLVLKKAPKWVNVLLWGIVAVRLICPFTIESALSLIPSAQTIPMNIEMAAKPAIDSGVEVVNSMVNPVIAASFTPNPAASANPLQIWIPLAAVIWAFGMVLMFLYTAISYWRLTRRIDAAVLYRDNIFQSEHVSSPFVLGIIKPKIYLPFQMNEQDLQHVVAHEQSHIRRKDHWWKPFGFLLLTIHWFNPLMWLAYVLLCRDIELACDEKVIKELDNEQRADYTQALVSCSINRRMIAACPLAFGEVGVKDRVKTIMNYKKPTFWLILVALILCVIVAVCFLTDPIQERNSLSFLNYKHSISMSEYQDVIPAVHYTSENDQGSIGIGMVEGKAFAAYLDSAHWTEKRMTPSDLSSPGSVAVNVADNLRITIYDRNFAAVEFNDEVCYYRIKANDYQRIQDLLMPADSERLEMASETRLELALGVVAIKENDTQTEKQRLSLNDVIILSQKGYDLNWSDFDQYEYIETGFGLYIRVYEINDMFRLMIGGNHPEGYPDKDPMYIYLTLVEDKETKIDIRDGGVTEFIAEHKTDSAEIWDRIPMVMMNGTLYLDTGRESTVMARCGMMDGEITSQVPGNEEPTVDDQSNFGIGYGYQYGAIEGTIEINMNGKWWVFATEKVRNDIQFPTTETAFKFNFAGNTSGGQRMGLTEDKPYWCITVVNEGTNGINIDILGTIYMVDAGTTGHIYPDKAWDPGTYLIDFGTAGGIGMEGYAICSISSAPFMAEEPFARKIYSAERRSDHPLVVYISSEWAADQKSENIELPFNHLLIKEDGSGLIDGVDVIWEICDKYTSEQGLHIELRDDNEYVVSVVYWRDSQLLQIVDQNDNLIECFYHRIAYATT